MSAGHRLAALENLLEPYLEIICMAWWPLAGSAGTIRVDGRLKPTGLTPGALPPAMRAALFETSQTVIRAVEEAGYQHNQPPKIDIAGNVTQVDDTVFIETAGTIQLELRPLDAAG